MTAHKTSWEKFAAWYDKLVQDPASYQRKVILPGILKLLNLKGNETILDIGCASGFFTNELAKKAKQVIGIDISPAFIKIARNRHKKNNLKFLVGNIKNLPFLKDKFDIATLVMVIENIDDAKTAFKEIAKALKPRGKMLIVMNHPVLRTQRQTGWEWDEKRKLQYRRVDSYLSEMKIPIQMHPGSAPQEITWTFHRPLQTYIKYLKENNFCITDLEEWISHKVSQPGPRAKAEDKARKEIPMFMALLAKYLN